MRKFIGLAIVASVFATAASAPASAGIYCQGPWQIVNGSEIATPFCGDTYLAKVARSYGMRVSGRAVRVNPSVKAEVCRLIGHDNRASEICAGEMPDSDGYHRTR